MLLEAVYLSLSGSSFFGLTKLIFLKGWNVQVCGSFMFIFNQKLNACKDALLNWSKAKFKNAAIIIKELEAKLVDFINEPGSQVNV